MLEKENQEIILILYPFSSKSFYCGHVMFKTDVGVSIVLNSIQLALRRKERSAVSFRHVSLLPLGGHPTTLLYLNFSHRKSTQNLEPPAVSTLNMEQSAGYFDSQTRRRPIFAREHFLLAADQVAHILCREVHGSVRK